LFDENNDGKISREEFRSALDERDEETAAEK